MFKRKRDFSKKDFRNPFFPKKQKKRRFWPVRLVIPVGFLLLLIGLYFLNVNSNLRIKNIVVAGHEHISQAEIKGLILEQLNKSRFLFFSQGNILFFNKRQAKKTLSQNYFLDELKVEKRYFDTISVELKEKTVMVIFQTGADNYYLDLSGVILKKADKFDIVSQAMGDTSLIRAEINSDRFPLIIEQSAQPVQIGQKALAQETIDFVIKTTAAVKKEADFEISRYLLADPASSEITLKTKEGWEARFKMTESPEIQVQSLLAILEEKIKDRSKLQYIDLRFGQKIFIQ